MQCCVNWKGNGATSIGLMQFMCIHFKKFSAHDATNTLKSWKNFEHAAFKQYLIEF